MNIGECRRVYIMENGMPELKAGMIVEIEDGNRYLIVKDSFENRLGIINKVFKFKDNFQCINTINDFSDLSNFFIELIWERKPATDWSKVAVDTKVLVKMTNEWIKAYFSKYEDGIIYVFKGGRTSFTVEKTVDWFYSTNTDEAVLYEGNENLLEENK